MLMVLLNLVEKRFVFAPKWTIAWRHGARDAILNNHLQLFGSPMAIEEKAGRSLVKKIFQATFMAV